MTIQHDDWLLEQLKDPEFAAEFLNAAKEDDDPNTYGTAFQKAAQARGNRELSRSRAHRKANNASTAFPTTALPASAATEPLSPAIAATGAVGSTPSAVAIEAVGPATGAV